MPGFDPLLQKVALSREKPEETEIRQTVKLDDGSSGSGKSA